MISRFLAWRRYRRALAAAIQRAESRGYEISPPVLEQLRGQARAFTRP